MLANLGVEGYGGKPGLSFTRSAPDQRSAHQGHAAKPQEGPVRNTSPQKAPIHFGAVTTALKNHGDHALQGEGFDHSVDVSPARCHFRGIPLQPRLARRHIGPAYCQRHQHARTCNLQAFSACGPGNCCSYSYQNKSISLHHAHRAGHQAHHFLQIQSKGQHANTGHSDCQQNTARCSV